MKNSVPINSDSQALHLALGRLGEQLAIAHLERHGYRIVATNFVVPVGYGLSGRKLTGEIDIVAYDKTIVPFTLAFIEVKTRTRTDIATPEAAVDVRKQRQIVRVARLYRRLMRVEGEPYRYDVVSIVALPAIEAEVLLLPNYFTEQRFARSGWHSQKF